MISLPLARLFGPIALVLAGLAPLCARPGEGEPLDLIRGTEYQVATVAELKNAINAANAQGEPATILIADGVYTLDVTQLQLTCPQLVVRSASGNRDAVVIRGPDEGVNASLLNVFLVSANNIVISDMTIGYCRWHGIQVRGESPYDVSGLTVHNCRLVNCNEQFIKGSSSDTDPVGATDGVIENCLFEFTSGWAYQYYTGGIDIHKGVNWVVRDNLFRNIRNPGSGIAEHAVHFWKRCTTQPQNIVVERNWIINCDRGIGFGLGTFFTGHDGGSSVIRNNMIYNDGAGPNTDVGIGLESANDVAVHNNTVVIPTYWAPIEYRFADSSNVSFRNNLTDKTIRNRNDAPAATLQNNLETTQSDWFVDQSAGDLHLVPGVDQVMDQGAPLDSFKDDMDGDTRPRLDGWDIGADEYDPVTADSDRDGMADEWESDGGLDPLSAVGDDGPDGDPDEDGVRNGDEFLADTNPTNSSSRLVMDQVTPEAGGNTIQWRGGVVATQFLERSVDVSDPDSWEMIRAFDPPTPTVNTFKDEDLLGFAFYRIVASRP